MDGPVIPSTVEEFLPRTAHVQNCIKLSLAGMYPFCKNGHYNRSVMIYIQGFLVDIMFFVRWLASFIHAVILVLVSEFNGGYFMVRASHSGLISQLGMFTIDLLTEHVCMYICEGCCLFM